MPAYPIPKIVARVSETVRFALNGCLKTREIRLSAETLDCGFCIFSFSWYVMAVSKCEAPRSCSIIILKPVMRPLV